MTVPAQPAPHTGEPPDGGGEDAPAAATVDAAAAAGRRTPDFFVLGHQKCGTTALYFMLKAHPQIFMPEVKEPRFLATDLRSRFAPRNPDAIRLQTLDGYLSLFEAAEPERRVGEASPQYLRSQAAPANIRALCPDARMIAILREPADFLRSFHLQMVSSEIESQRDLRRALELEPQRRAGRRIPRNCHHPKSLLYSEHVRYVEQLSRYRERFPEENLLTLVYDDFRADNDGTVRQVLRFLDVEDTVPVAAVETKPLKAVRSLPLHRLANAARKARTNAVAAGTLGRAVNTLTPAAMRGEGVRALWRRGVYRTPPPPDPELMLELRRRFKPEVLALSEYLDRDLIALWGYDRLD
jgi:hypothetical protein